MSKLTNERIKCALTLGTVAVAAVAVQQAFSGNKAAIVLLAVVATGLYFAGKDERPISNGAQNIKNKMLGTNFFDTCEHVKNNVIAGATASVNGVTHTLLAK